MQSPTDKKNLTQLEVIELLTLIKDHTEQEVADHFGMTQPAISYYRTKYGATNPKVIDRIILQLERDGMQDDLGVNYKKQETCTHPHIFFKCPHCKLILGEKDARRMIQILKTHLKTLKEKKLVEQKI